MDARISLVLDHLRELGYTSQHVQRVKVSSLAAQAGLSPRHFSNIFIRDTGLSPKRYLKRLRLEIARDLLDDARLSLKEIRAEAGFSDRSHFDRDFRRAFSATPLQFRRRAPAQPKPQVDKMRACL